MSCHMTGTYPDGLGLLLPTYLRRIGLTIQVVLNIPDNVCQSTFFYLFAGPSGN